MSNRVFLSQNDAKYKNARVSLLMIVVFSAINLFSISFGEFYFLFSSYFTQLMAVIGVSLAEEFGSTILIVMCAVGLISVIPYLICWIFSKKHVGWMIGALVLFSVDSVVFLIDFVPAIASGQFFSLIDLLFHIWAIGSLAAGVKYGLNAKKDAETAESNENADAAFAQIDNMEDDFPRQITVTRKKSFLGCAVAVSVYVNRKEVCQLKNGETKSFTAPGKSFELGAMFTSGMANGKLTVPAGSGNASFQLSVKSGFTANQILITPMDQTPVA